MRVGSIVRLKQAILGNPEGTKGIVYEEYDIGFGESFSIIFENGNYDGFGPEEDFFYEEIGYNQNISKYVFKNVIQLSKDFNEGYFKFEV